VIPLQRPEPREQFAERLAPQGVDRTLAEGVDDDEADMVERLPLRPGGELVYTMTATAPEQIEFMRNAGMPLKTQSRKTFTEIDAPRRIAYDSLVDFVPGVEPYTFSTTVDIEPTDSGELPSP
jgi:hypothetical protein